MTSIVLPQGFGMVGLAVLSTTWVLTWQTTLVNKYRKRSGIEYPQLYAERAQVEASQDALLFNCMQRAHANTLEVIPIIAITTLVAGVKHPYLAATGCGLWVLSRIPYTLGYTTGDPIKRTRRGGIVGPVMMGCLLVGSAYTALDLVGFSV
ncbi:hypothetical protein SERLA73DRAFT_187059 [Serpula lacrymans var. lacrymans S7.3]|uniref:Membrane-associated proteins in eicosanoid and glutathione metabolism n=2 Tax=Serpula lacrymans var. lacrymans TaxID=341189 RepID=F8Q8E3_SERL3|nr:uncharacterized protein SERLADRAFT_476411 [Serpula lacrymans var. lacrymans S7.9]EGN95831.1 hypothetical protein SERLA73DRAFT_187059 [Serpula lacrymans var. lacrymans S7.3]EGO21352.1 hypothetical protein SERLADRAFT_476411 [Serpula lacrymans var. lacrymans S7.9]